MKRAYSKSKTKFNRKKPHASAIRKQDILDQRLFKKYGRFDMGV